ncbi:MAG: cation:proton antiporter regulatory subunit [Planctomycetota bacterium]
MRAAHPAVGATVAELDFAACGATVLALTRGGERIALPGGDTRVCAGDVLALTGSSVAVERALERLSNAPRAVIPSARAPRAPERSSARDDAAIG